MVAVAEEAELDVVVVAGEKSEIGDGEIDEFEAGGGYVGRAAAKDYSAGVDGAGGGEDVGDLEVEGDVGEVLADADGIDDGVSGDVEDVAAELVVAVIGVGGEDTADGVVGRLELDGIGAGGSGLKKSQRTERRERGGAH